LKLICQAILPYAILLYATGRAPNTYQAALLIDNEREGERAREKRAHVGVTFVLQNSRNIDLALIPRSMNALATLGLLVETIQADTLVISGKRTAEVVREVGSWQRKSLDPVAVFPLQVAT
jgi:hypothetical protein